MTSFTSISFFAFLAVTLLLYYLLPRKLRPWILLAASIGFCLAAGPACLIFVAVSWISTYLAASGMEKRKEKKKLFFILCLVLNLGLLAALKYTNFILQLGGRESKDVSMPAVLGISFYTFRVVSYLTDVYRGKYPAEKRPQRLLLYICFFPQMVQGPISRYDALQGSLTAGERPTLQDFGVGARRMLWGLFKKLVIADRLAPAVAVLAASPKEMDGLFGLLGGVLYTVQLFFDFSGGIDIAIGAAELFGVRLPENFDRPFLSQSVGEFWRRWHITLSDWFRDYLYIPLGGSRKGKGRKLLNLMIVFTVSGIWHGASWGYILWGICNGVFVVLENLCRKKPKRSEGMLGALKTAGTLLLVVIAFLFMMHSSAGNVFAILGSLFCRPFTALTAENFAALGLSAADWIAAGAAVLITAAVSLWDRKKSVWDKLREKRFLACTVFAVLVLLVLIFGVYGTGYDASRFIYGQF